MCHHNPNNNKTLSIFIESNNNNIINIIIESNYNNIINIIIASMKCVNAAWLSILYKLSNYVCTITDVVESAQEKLG